MKTDRYCVVQYTKEGKFVGVVSGMGKNKGTLDSDHSKTQANYWAKRCRRDEPEFDFKVETTT